MIDKVGEATIIRPGSETDPKQWQELVHLALKVGALVEYERDATNPEIVPQPLYATEADFNYICRDNTYWNGSKHAGVRAWRSLVEAYEKHMAVPGQAELPSITFERQEGTAGTDREPETVLWVDMISLRARVLEARSVLDRSAHNLESAIINSFFGEGIGSGTFRFLEALTAPAALTAIHSSGHNN
jgi:hypothetical protein